MGDNQIDPQEGESHEDNDIVLEGKKIASSAQDTNSSKLPNNTKSERIKGTPLKSPKKKMQGSQSLVLEMYSHLRIQRKLEEEKNSKIAQSDRRRQKIKRELAISCSPDGSSLKSFGSTWTQFRMLRGPQGKLQEALQAKDVVSQSPASDSSHELDDQDSAKREIVNGPGLVRFQAIHHGQVGHFNGAKYEITNQTKFSQPTQQRRQLMGPSHRSPQSQRQNDQAFRHRGAHFNDNSQYMTSRKIATPNSNTTHVLKGPGKIQIRFSTCSTPASRQANRGQKHNYQWDTMPAGSLTSVQPALITLDGSLL